VLLLGAVSPRPLAATVGTYSIGYGADSVGLAGAGSALIDGYTAIYNNPAGITRVKNSEAGFDLTALIPTLNWDNGSSTTASDFALFPMPYGGYVRKFSESIYFGLAMIGVGGMGASFSHVPTYFGEPDGTKSMMSWGAFMPTLGIKFNDWVRIGLTPLIGFAFMSYELYPETPLMGHSVSGLNGTGYGGKLGLQARLHKQFSIGLSYQTPSKISWQGGKVSGPAVYTSDDFGGSIPGATMSGFQFAQFIGAGASFEATPQFLIHFDMKWFDWSKAVPPATEVNADNALPAFFLFGKNPVFSMGWKDQWLWSWGLEYHQGAKMTYRAGYAYATQIVPAETINPLMPAISQHHWCAGIGYQWTDRTRVDSSFMYSPKSKVTYNLDSDALYNYFFSNPPTQPFAIDMTQYAVGFMIKYRWGE
jgi:long-chain fatty acid transport protein